jgi:hypothetical protein
MLAKLPCEWCDHDMSGESITYDDASSNYICEKCVEARDDMEENAKLGLSEQPCQVIYIDFKAKKIINVA